jgi:hypothetical protein
MNMKKSMCNLLPLRLVLTVFKENVEKDGWSCGSWVVKSAVQQVTDEPDEESIEDFRDKCKANNVTWFSKWMQVASWNDIFVS